MADAERAVWARAPRPHRVARDYAVVARDRHGIIELDPESASLFADLETPRALAALTDRKGLDDSQDIAAMVAELAEAGVLVANGPPTPAGESSLAEVRVGDDPRGVIVAHGLTPTARVCVEDALDAFDLFGWAAEQRVIPLLAQAVHDGAVTLPESANNAMVERDRTIQRSAVAIEVELLSVREVFDVAGIDVVLLKGLATSHLDHPSPAWRQTSDVDLLLAPEQVSTAAGLLVGHGAAYVASDEISTIAKATTVRMPSGVEIDLHARPVMLPYGAVELRPTVPCQIGDRTFQSLERSDRWANAVAHYALSDSSFRRTSALRDVLATWPMPEEYARWNDAIRRWRATTLLHVVEQDLADLGIALADPDWLAGHTQARSKWYERELVRTQTPGPLLHWAAPLSVLGWRDRARHVGLMAKARWQRTRPR